MVLLLQLATDVDILLAIAIVTLQSITIVIKETIFRFGKRIFLSTFTLTKRAPQWLNTEAKFHII